MALPTFSHEIRDHEDPSRVDGVHHVRQRPNSRLWYRSSGDEIAAAENEATVESLASAGSSPSEPVIPVDWVEMLNLGVAAPTVTVLGVDRKEALLVLQRQRQLADIAKFALASNGRRDEPNAVESDRPIEHSKQVVSTLERVTAAIRAEDEAAARLADAPVVSPAAMSGADTFWSVAHARAPMLLLSASPMLDGRRPGPIVGPGTTFRIVDVQDGVVALEVLCDDGLVVAGYGNVVDVKCIDPTLGRGRGTGKLGIAPQIARSRWLRITGSLRGSIAG